MRIIASDLPPPPPPVDIEMAAEALDAHNDFRVVRRMIPMLRSTGRGRVPGMYAGCALDVETTGLDHGSDRIIELCMASFWADGSGRIVDVGPARTWLEDPGRQLSAEISALTGLTDTMLTGKSIIEAEATGILRDADFVIAHHAAFDRPFVERRLPLAAGLRWCCTVHDLDWRKLGFEGRGLGHLLGQIGWFHDAHRAEADVQGLLHLLDHPLLNGGTVLTELIARSSLPSWIVTAAGAPIETRFALKGRGYRWNPEGKAWWREVRDEALADEREWLNERVYAGRGGPDLRRIDWSERHSGS